MNEYELTITRREPNPEHAEQLKVWMGKQYYGVHDNEPSPYLKVQVLTITVSEETFAAIRKAALETL